MAEDFEDEELNEELDENSSDVIIPQEDTDESTQDESGLHKVIFAQSMYREWYLDYASYVILGWRTAVSTRWPTSWVTP